MQTDLMYGCPKWNRCSAPVCPLSATWCLARHLTGEPVCLWLREWSKPGGEPRVRAHLPEDMAEAVGNAYSELAHVVIGPPASAERGFGEVRRALARAATTGSVLNRAPPRNPHPGEPSP